MLLNKKLQKNYTTSSVYYQIKLPLDLEILIPSDDPVRLLSAFVEGMELSDLYKTYGKIKKNQATPRQLFKIIVYASMNRIYSSRDIETACRRDVNFMYFDAITLIPMDLDAINPDIMTAEDKKLLNDYHKKVYETLTPYLNEEEKVWLEKYTRAI